MEEDLELELPEFTGQEIDVIYRFAADWLSRRRKDPENWPLKLPLSEWHRQLKLFHDADPALDEE